jgi:hypothetical protein
MKKEIGLLVSILFVLALTSFVAAIPTSGNIKINEFTVDPQNDWDSSGFVTTDDEWFEIYNTENTEIDLTGWNLTLEDTSLETITLNDTIPAFSFLTIINPSGSQSNDGRLRLYNSSGFLIDEVIYGDFDDDGNETNNAPDGNTQDEFDECIARTPNGQDSNQDYLDFTKTKCTYNAENNFTFTPVAINDLQASPSCALENQNVTLSAEINGSIQEVTLNYNAGSGWEQVEFASSSPGIFEHTVSSTELSESENLEYYFEVEDIQTSIISGSLNVLDIKASTTLIASPEEPDGQAGWYVSEPDFEFENPDAATITYRWNGEMFTTTPGSTFGLDGTPNSGNITGGIHALHYASDVCNETEQTFIGKFDFKNPTIKNLFPDHSSEEFNLPNLTIQAEIDEIFQGNSGVNISSITMEIDNIPVSPEVELNGIDAIVSYSQPLSDGFHQVELHVSDNAGRETFKIWNFELLSTSDFELFLWEPSSGIFEERRIPFNITLSRPAEIIEYMNNLDNNPRWRRLCKDCDSWGAERKRTLSLNEGENEITIRAIDALNNQDSATVEITVDSRDPRIRKTGPSGDIATSLFSIEFDEENPESLVLHYGTSENMKTHELNLSQDCQIDRNYECETFVDLTEFDQQEIEYFFVLEDIAQNQDSSRPRALLVDMSYPSIDAFSYEVDGNRVHLTLEVTEATLDEITYIDSLDPRPRERRLCTQLTDNLCEKSIRVNDGFHNLTITVYDEAGNTAQAFAYFFTDSHDPRIRRTSPRSGFASGLFEVEFDEENPTSLVLYYGNFAETRNETLNLSNCMYDRNVYCQTHIDLMDFEGQEIEYFFTLEDTVGNFDVSRTVDLEVDSIPPGVDLFDYTIDDRKVDFFFDLDEENLDKIEYIDKYDNRPRYRTLCNRLSDFGTCSRTERFRPGPHNLDIRAVDEAGNEAFIAQDLNFTVF